MEKAKKLADFRAAGLGIVRFGREASKLMGHKIPNGSISRHLKHYVEAADDLPDSDAPKPSDIAILDSIIGAGFRNSRNWKPTIRDTLEAMKLKTAMTGNSAFQDLIDLMDTDDDDDIEAESEEAMLSEEERRDEGDEELEEPLAGE